MSNSISVVIPAYNAATYLAEAVASIRAQSVAVSEIIVVDDGSSDGTAELAKSLDGVTLVSQENGGPAKAINTGIKAATGDLVAFISADDKWKSDKLEKQLDALEPMGETGLVFGHMLHFISPELDADTASKLRCPPDPMAAYSAGTLLAHRSVFEKVGVLDESFKVGEFMDWFSRAKDAGCPVKMLDDVVSMRRVHKSNHSTTTLKSKTYAPVLKAMLDRRRAMEKK